MTTYAIKKENKFVKDFTDGKKLTVSLKFAEKYTNKKAALIAAQAYGKQYGKGFKVVELF